MVKLYRSAIYPLCNSLHFIFWYLPSCFLTPSLLISLPNPRYKGQFCETPICNLPCLNGGKCMQPDTCECPPDWEGPQCQIARIAVGNDLESLTIKDEWYDDEEYAVCSAWGGHHYTTFDQQHFFYPGKLVH